MAFVHGIKFAEGDNGWQVGAGRVQQRRVPGLQIAMLQQVLMISICGPATICTLPIMYISIP